MKTSSPTNLTDAIIRAAIPMTRSVASFLENSKFLWDDDPNRLVMTSTDLLQAASKWRTSDYSIENTLREQSHIEWRDLATVAARLEQHLASLTLQQAREVQRSAGRRPDVLGLCWIVIGIE